jgi:hypothetical protein
MSTLVTRAGKGSPLTHNEVDTNFTNLNTDKVEKTSADITGGTINGTTVGATTPAAGTFTTLTANTTFQYGASSANYGEGTGGATTKAVEFKTLGSDTNVAYAIRTKGTGAIDLAAGSSGVNISNGGTVTAITRTATGSGYTSLPSVAITAPTTAGGVQATATCTLGTSSPTVTFGGTGYTVNDVLTLVGGTGTAATLTVTSVSSGVITAVTSASAGAYTVLPTSPVSVTGGTGSSATFTLVAGNTFVNSAFTITNAGSGYVEQPTVTFSGGGGSGAAAYATVGSFAVIKAIGSGTGVVTNQAFTFQTPNSITGGNPAFIIRDAASFDSWYQMGPSSTQAFLVAKGNANASAYLGASGSGSVRLTTNGDSITEQFRVSHTASAVNYVQVTGAATGSGNYTTISSQGSDAAVNLRLFVKGTGTLDAQINSSTRWKINSDGSVDSGISASGGIGFKAGITASQVNYFQTVGNVAGSAPILSAQGSDTDIDITLTPKGAGNVRFGTYTAGVLTPTGYITIKDSGGTTRRLLVG